MEYYFSDFETSIYSINDLISTGNMAIFPEEEKKAIYILKNELEKLNAVEKSAHDDVQNRWDVFYTNVDELHEYGYSDKQHPSVQNWYYNLDAKEYRLQHNVFAIVLWLYNKQINDLFPIIKTQLESTLALIEKGLSKDD